MSCPKCASEEWKLASVIYSSGKSKVTTTTLGAGLGANADAFGGGAGIGIGSASTNGTQQTELSKLAAPPAKIMRPAQAVAILGGCIFVIGLVFFINTSSEEYPFLTNFFFVFAPGMMAIACFRMLFTNGITKEINDAHKKALAEYEKKKMCLRCGTFYFSGSETASSSPSATKKCPYCAESIRSEAILCKHCNSKL